MSQSFPKPYRAFGGNVKIELDFFSYATKTDLKEATGIDTSNFALKIKFSWSKNRSRLIGYRKNCACF